MASSQLQTLEKGNTTATFYYMPKAVSSLNNFQDLTRNKAWESLGLQAIWATTSLSEAFFIPTLYIKKQTHCFHPFRNSSVPCSQSSLTYFKTTVFDLEPLSPVSPVPGAFVFCFLCYRTQDTVTKFSKQGKVLTNHRTDDTSISHVIICIFNLLLHTL